MDVSFTVFCVCTVTDFSADDKASGVTFCTAVLRRPKQGMRNLVNFAPPEEQNRTNRPARGHAHPHVNIATQMCRNKRHASL